MTAHDFDRAIDTLARRQHGVFHYRQVLAAGGSLRMIRARLQSGAWLELDRHVYALPSHPGTWLRQCRAATLAIPRSAVSGRASAAVHGLDGVPRASIEVSGPRGGRRETKLARVRLRDGLPTTTVQGIPVVTVPQSLCDLAGAVHIGETERALDHALVRSLTTPEEMVAFYDQLRKGRLPGSSVLGMLLDDRASGYVPPTNVLEAGLANVLSDPRIPESHAQAAFPWRTEAPHRVDRFLPPWRRIIEVDGRLWHARFNDFERDRARDHDAQMHGFEVTRFTFRQIVSCPEYALAVLLAIGQQVRPAA